MIARLAKDTALALAATVIACGAAHAEGSVTHGEQLYEGCQDCHSIDTNELGPMHKGVFGRKAGSCGAAQPASKIARAVIARLMRSGVISASMVAREVPVKVAAFVTCLGMHEDQSG